MRLNSLVRWSIRGAAGLLLAVMLVSPASGGPPKERGKTLDELMERYMTWALGGDQEDHVGEVKFMPLPAGTLVDDGATGSAADPVTYEGEMKVTLKEGESFVMPVAVWFGEVYSDGSVDPILDKRVFTRSDVHVTIDGKSILDSGDDDLRDYYVKPTAFDPTIIYDEPTGYGSVGAAFFQGLGLVQGPLSKGKHTMKLYSELIVNDPESGLNFGVRYVNTWHITVK